MTYPFYRDMLCMLYMVDNPKRKYTLLGPILNERRRRLWAAAEAHVLGHGGIARVVCRSDRAVAWDWGNWRPG